MGRRAGFLLDFCLCSGIPSHSTGLASFSLSPDYLCNFINNDDDNEAIMMIIKQATCDGPAGRRANVDRRRIIVEDRQLDRAQKYCR